jgi:hypothetical protein
MKPTSSVTPDLVCAATFNNPLEFIQPIVHALRDDFKALRNFEEQRAVPRQKDCCFPVIIHQGKDDDDYDEYRRQADQASACALLQQRFFGFRLPLYQILMEDGVVRVMRCYWFEQGGVIRYTGAPVASPESPYKFLEFDLWKPLQMLECLLLIANMIKYLPELYTESAFGFQRAVVSGNWSKDQVHEAK